MKKPNFFLLGAGRSGSTYLYNLLIQHPEVFLSDPKEPSYFSNSFQIVQNPVDYFNLYKNAGNAKVIGEASHVYLSNPTTAELLKLLFPEAKFLLILRNPVDRAYSLFNWMRRFEYEQCGTFEEALQIEDKRFNSKAFRENPPHYFYNSMYFRSGLYGQQIERYFDLFEKEQFYFLKFEDFVQRPKHYMKKVFLFLNIEKACPLDLKVRKNAGAPDIIRSETRRSLMKKYQSDFQLLEQLTGISF